MSDLMDKLLADKLKAGKALVDMPFEEKIVLMEKMRVRNELLAENPLRKATPKPRTSVTIGGKQP